jgi:hypothetical protein
MIPNNRWYPHIMHDFSSNIPFPLTFHLSHPLRMVSSETTSSKPAQAPNRFTVASIPYAIDTWPPGRESLPRPDLRLVDASIPSRSSTKTVSSCLTRERKDSSFSLIRHASCPIGSDMVTTGSKSLKGDKDRHQHVDSPGAERSSSP